MTRRDVGRDVVATDSEHGGSDVGRRAADAQPSAGRETGAVGLRWINVPAAVETGAALVSMALAGAAILVVMRRIPRVNVARSEIVGYPLFANFNGDRYPSVWYLAGVGWPFVSLLVFAGLRWALRSAGLLGRMRLAIHVSRAVPTTQPAKPASDEVGMGRVAAGARLFAVGLVWGFAGAIVRDSQGLGFWRDLAVISAVYVLAALGAAAVLSRLRRRSSSILKGAGLISAANAIGAALSVVGLIAVSGCTTLLTRSDAVSHPMDWLPVPLGVPLAAVVTGAVGVGLVRARRQGLTRVRVVERRAVFLVSVPVAMVLATAVLPGGLSAFQVFENGQQMATLRLLGLGEFPWRDFLPFHGLLTDTFYNAVGYVLLSHSAWGSLAGAGLILVPLTWISLYLFAYRVAGSSWAAMLALVLLLFNSTLTLGSANTLAFGAARLLPWPLILILLAVTIERRTRGLAIGLGMVAVAFAVLVPEASYAVPACGVAVIAHDAYRATWTRTRIRRDFSLTIWSIAGGGVIAAALLVVLVSNHAVGGFLDYYGVVVSGHTLVGGIPLPSWSGATEQLLFWIVAPGVAVLLGAGILALKARLRFALKTTDFLLLASGVFTVLYYGEEFMGRTDPSHGGLAYFAAMPLILLCLWDVTGWLNGWIRTRLGAWRVGKLRWPVMYLAVACAAITASTPLLNALSAAPMDFRASAPTEPLLSSLGYMDYPNQRLYSDIGVFLSAFLKPGEEIYDFSGDPGIYYWILDYRPATTHFTIGEDTTLRQQQDTVTQLEAARPLFAVLSSSMKTSLSVWDGIVNGVREYQIAQYILDHYEPFADVGDQLIYVRDGAAPTIPAGLRAELGAQLTLTDLPFRYPDCAWGYVPEFLDVPPPAGETGVAVGGAAGPSDSWSLSVPPGHTWADYHWIDLAIAPGSQGASFTLDDREVPDEYHDITFQTLPGGQSSYRFPIGACPQWYGYGAADLRLSSSAPVGITQIELLA